MTRYFFDYDDGHCLVSDDTGLDLSGLDAACKAAIASLPEAALGKRPDTDKHEFTVSVREGAGRALFRAKLALWSEWL